MNALNKKIKELFDSGVNIMEYFRNQNNSSQNSIEAIKISYDLQAGSYIRIYNDNLDYNSKYTASIAKIFDKFGKINSLLEAGVGEATTMANVVTKMNATPDFVCGFDISWSRVKHARAFAESKKVDSNWLFTGDLFQIPLADNSIDVVYTSHSIEPNGGREVEALQELYRVASKYLVLLEPAYELASDEAKERIIKHGYVRNLPTIAKELGYKVIEYRLFDFMINPLNPTGLLIIEKNVDSEPATPSFICPATNGKLEKSDSCYFSPDSLMAYPIIGNIPCLLAENGILASAFDKEVEL